MLYRIVLAALATVIAATGGVLAYAPYLPRLLLEGYPAPLWPAPGAFATIDGAAAPNAIPLGTSRASRPLPSDLAQLLAESGAKAFLVERRGVLELEYYAPGFDAESKFNSFSMAKSLVGALIFRAVADGRLTSLDAPVGDILPTLGDAAFRRVSIRDLLLMRGGVLFARDDPLKDGEVKDFRAALANPLGPMARLHAAGLGGVGDRLTADPALAGRFLYQNINTAILGAALEALYARSLADLLSEKLWRPAGAGGAHWRRYSEAEPVTPYCCIFALPADWLRIGRYLMRNGTPEAPFLPQPLWREWVGADLAPDIRARGVYGHHLRHDVLDRPGERLAGPFDYMLGQGGQVLYLLPGEDMVVLRVGERMQRLHSTLYAAARAIAGP
jgi:CubicO group peptidase (beta-lactamase class C family)